MVALALVNLHVALGGMPQAFAAGIDLSPPVGELLTSPFPFAGGVIPSLEQMLSVRTRDLLAKKWRKAKIEKSVAYEGTPIDVRLIHDPNELPVTVITSVETLPSLLNSFSPAHPCIGSSPDSYSCSSQNQVIRGVKSSHSCWVKCKNNKDCSRFTYITGKWKKCELYRRGDRQLKKVKTRGAISGYAEWRVSVKGWGKQKPVKKQTNDEKCREPAYEAPGSSSQEAYEAPGWSGDGAYEAPNTGSGIWDSEFGPSAPSGGGPEIISDYKLMSGKTIYGRRINSILPCVGNIARRYTDCQTSCNRDGKCDAWTWASFDCSWVGDSRDSGVCYLMADSNERDVFEAPSRGDFVSGMKRGSNGGGGGGGGGGGTEMPYEDDWSAGDEFNPPVFNSEGICILNCGVPQGPTSGAYEAPGY